MSTNKGLWIDKVIDKVFSLHVYGEDYNIWRHRLNNLSKVELKRAMAARILKKLFQEQWKPWYEKTRKLETIHGVVRRGTENAIRIFKNHETGVSSDWLQPKEDFDRVLITPHEDLPLLVSEQLNEEAKNLLEDRLRGRAKGSVLKQDLVDEYELMEHRRKNISTMIAICDKIMLFYIEKKYSDFYQKHKFEDVFVKLRVNDREYIYSFGSTGFKLVCVPETVQYHDDGVSQEDLWKKNR